MQNFKFTVHWARIHEIKISLKDILYNSQTKMSSRQITQYEHPRHFEVEMASKHELLYDYGTRNGQLILVVLS